MLLFLSGQKQPDNAPCQEQRSRPDEQPFEAMERRPGNAPENGSEESEKTALSGNGGAERLPSPKRKGRLHRLRGAWQNVPDLRAFR